MSWAAMNYVRRLKRESGIAGNARYVLMMIAWRISNGHIESRPVPLGCLARDTGLDPKTVRACIKRVIAAGLLRVGQAGRGRGQFSTYVMPNLAGPLFMVADDDPEKGGVAPSFPDPEKGGVAPSFPDPEKGGVAPSFMPEKGASRPRSVRTSSSQDVRTKRTTTTEKPVAAALYRMSLEYLDWFAATYPDHHHGAQVTVDVEADGPAVLRLLTHPQRSIEQLKAMTVAMWTVTTVEDPWLARAVSRGLKLLCHAADRLDIIVGLRARPVAAAGCLYHHDPPCASVAACLDRERQRVDSREQLA